jgi:hypothetical protein
MAVIGSGADADAEGNIDGHARIADEHQKGGNF